MEDFLKVFYESIEQMTDIDLDELKKSTVSNNLIRFNNWDRMKKHCLKKESRIGNTFKIMISSLKRKILLLMKSKN